LVNGSAIIGKIYPRIFTNFHERHRGASPNGSAIIGKIYPRIFTNCATIFTNIHRV
jgi:hypothetical protein